MASLRDKIAANAQPYLQPGEQVQGSFASQQTSQWWILVGAIVFLIMNRYRPVVATDRRILVFDGGIWSQTRCNALVAELPRTFKLGPAGGLWHKVQISQDETLHINRRFHKDVAAIDAAGLPAGPVGPAGGQAPA